MAVRFRSESNSRRQPNPTAQGAGDITRMNELSDTKIRNAKPAHKEYTLADGQGDSNISIILANRSPQLMRNNSLRLSRACFRHASAARHDDGAVRA
jgi:hypothetical protein